MRRDTAIEILRSHRQQLALLGVAHLSVFGSVARDEAGDLSDVDVVVDTPDGGAPGLFRLARISSALERILGSPVDVISRRGLDHTTDLKQRIAAEAVHVF